MSGADAEGGGEGEVGKMILLGDAADERARHSRVIDALAQEAVEDGAAGILRLEPVLEVERFEDVVGKADGDVGGIGVVGFGVFSSHFFLVGDDDVGIVLLVEEGEAVGGAFGGSGFQIVEIVGLFLVGSDPLAHVSENFLGEGLAFVGRDVCLEKIANCFVGADQADRGEVIFPVLMEALFDIAKVELGVGVESFLGELFDDFPFHFETLFGNIHEAVEPFEEIFFIFGEVANAREVDGDNADRPGQGIGAEESAATLSELTVIETEAATHAACVVGAHVGIDEIGEIGDAVFGGHFPKRRIGGILPVEVLGDVIGRDGEGEDASRGVAFGHHFGEGAIDHCHFGCEVAIRFFLRFAADHDMILRENLRWNNIHCDVRERRLESDARRDIHIEDK